MIRRQVTKSRRTAPVGRLVLWMVLALLLDMALGGVVGFIVGKHSADISGAAGLAGMAGICALFIMKGRAGRNREGDQVTIVGYLRETVDRTVLRLRTTTLAGWAAGFLAVAITGIFSGRGSPSSDDSISNLAVSVAIVLWLVQLAAGCVYAIVRRTRSGKL